MRERGYSCSKKKKKNSDPHSKKEWKRRLEIGDGHAHSDQRRVCVRGGKERKKTMEWKRKKGWVEKDRVNIERGKRNVCEDIT